MLPDLQALFSFLAILSLLVFAVSGLLIAVGLLLAQAARRFVPAGESSVLRMTSFLSLFTPILAMALMEMGTGNAIRPPIGVAGGVLPPVVRSLPLPDVASVHNGAALPWQLLGATWAFLGLLLGARYLRAAASVSRLCRGGDRESAGLAESEVARIAAQLGLATPKVVVVEGLASPFLAGVLRPTLVLPATAAQPDGSGFTARLVAHELAHLARQDNVWLAFTQAALLLLFHQPLAHVLSRRMVQVSDFVADDYVLRRSDAKGCERRAYANQLVEAARMQLDSTPPRHLAAVSLVSAQSPLALRIRRILNSDAPTLLHPSFATNSLTTAVLTASALAIAVEASALWPVRPTSVFSSEYIPPDLADLTPLFRAERLKTHPAFKELPLPEALDLVARGTGLRFVLPEDCRAIRVSVSMPEVTVEEAYNTLLNRCRLGWDFSEDQHTVLCWKWDDHPEKLQRDQLAIEKRGDREQLLDKFNALAPAVELSPPK